VSFSLGLLLCEGVDELLQWLKLLLIHKLELLDEVVKVLETGVEVSLLPKVHDLLEMRVVDVGVHTEETLEDVLHDVLEVLREGSVHS